MKPLLPLLALAAALSACASNELSRVDNGLLSELSESERQPVVEARRERDKSSDAHAKTSRDRKNAESRVKLAESGLEVAEAALEEAELAHEVAIESATATGQELEAAKAAADQGVAAVAVAEAELALRERELELAGASEQLAGAEARLAEARVEHAKAQAVSTLDVPETRELLVRDYLVQVRENEARVAKLRTTQERALGEVERASAALESAKHEATLAKLKGLGHL